MGCSVDTWVRDDGGYMSTVRAACRGNKDLAWAHRVASNLLISLPPGFEVDARVFLVNGVMTVTFVPGNKANIHRNVDIAMRKTEMEEGRI